MTRLIEVSTDSGKSWGPLSESMFSSVAASWFYDLQPDQFKARVADVFQRMDTGEVIHSPVVRSFLYRRKDAELALKPLLGRVAA